MLHLLLYLFFFSLVKFSLVVRLFIISYIGQAMWNLTDDITLFFMLCVYIRIIIFHLCPIFVYCGYCCLLKILPVFVWSILTPS